MRVLICGGGVIGASIAYFLSRRGVEAVLSERTGIACAASGKSGGCLALDWCDGTARRGVRGQVRLSPARHAQHHRARTAQDGRVGETLGCPTGRA
jgi:glycine/D-amino acid oxidase-like deaminating enzyme